MLADAINIEGVALGGVVVGVILTLGVTVIESYAFAFVTRVRAGAVVGRLFGANVASTFAGAVVMLYAPVIVHVTGVTRSIPAFVHGYIWVSVLLTLVYFAVSALVEATVVVRPAVAQRLQRSRPSLLKGVLAANVASYCVVGPLYYYATRPTFGGVTVTETSNWTANAALPVYFIGRDDHFIRRVNVDGTGLRTLVPYPAAAFLVSADGTGFAYRGTDGDLYAYRVGDAEPTPVWTTKERFMMTAVSLAPDKGRVAYAERVSSKRDQSQCRVKVFEIASRQTLDIGEVEPGWKYGPTVAWSRDGPKLYVSGEYSVAVFGERPLVLVDFWPPERPVEGELVESYVPTGPVLSSGQCWLEHWRDEKDLWSARVRRRGFGSELAIAFDGRTFLHLANDYGLPKFGLPGPTAPSFLPAGSELMFEWEGQTYLLDCRARRLALVAPGECYVLPTERFRVPVGEADRE